MFVVRYVFFDALEIGGWISICFGIKRLFTVHQIHRVFRRRHDAVVGDYPSPRGHELMHTADTAW